MPEISVVTTMYRSAPYLSTFYRRITQSVKQVTDDYELILVNDGTPDDSLELALELCDSDERIKIVDLSRNFGHHKAIVAGLAHAEGQRIFLIDCDLEEPPELLLDFHRAFEQYNGQVDSIYGVQKVRKGGRLERVSGQLFYKLFNRLAGIEMEENPLTVRLMSRRYVDAVLMHQESELFLAGILHIAGFDQKSMVVDKASHADSTYTMHHKLVLMSRGITSFSSVPLKVSLYSGFIVAFAAFVFGFYLVVRKLVFDDLIDVGWTSLIVSTWFIGGIILLSQGIIGIYLAKVYGEVKQRPNYIVRKVYRGSKRVKLE